MKKTKDYTLLAIAIPLAIAVLGNLPGCYSDTQKQGGDKRKYDYGIVKKGDTLFIYKDGKPVGCDVDSTGLHSIGDILEYAETGEEREQNKYVIDLPEEISQSTGNDLDAFKRNDTIFIQFKNK